MAKKVESRGGKPVLPRLSDAEWEVMKPLWEQGPLAARDVHAALPEGERWSIKTVKTLLSRLVAKNAVSYEQVGNSYLYRPALARDQVTRQEVSGFLDRVLDGAFSPVLAHFIRDSDMSQEEIARLRHLLDEKERQMGKKKRGGGHDS